MKELSSKVTTQNIKEAALAYVEMGWPIIPLCDPEHRDVGDQHRQKCKAPGKAPLLSNWTRRSVPTKEEVEQWFEQWPNCNIGLILGDTGTTNLVGIDVDGDVGEEILQDISRGVLPPTVEFKTGNGRRLVYELPLGAESKKVAQKGDDGELALLATGQQTVLPPSVHKNGTVYEWTKTPEDHDIEEAPQFVLNLILVQGEGDAQHEATVTLDDWNQKVPQGQRNDHLTKLAGSLIARRNIPKEQITAFLKTWNQNNCDPPLPEEEIEVMVENLHAAELAKQSGRKRKRGDDKPVLRPIKFAEHFIEEQRKKGTEWRYCVDRGIFYRCDVMVGPWEIVDTLYLQREVRRALIEQEETWDSHRHVYEVVSAIREVLADPVNDDLFDIGLHPDLNHVYVQNGMLDWRTLELKPWDPRTYSTIKLPAAWNPDAKNTEVYEEWNKILETWVPDKETRDFLQEYVGYCLIPDCSHRTAVFLYGPGSNGKSLFLEVIAKLFQGYIEFTPLHWVGERFESAKLLDKLVNVCGDIDSKYMTETSTLKSLIAGDPIRAEFKHGKSFHFHPVCRLMFSANQLPRSSDKSEGWYSRWKFVEFPKRFKTDTKFKRNLLNMMSRPDGLSALLCWAVEGLRRLYNTEEFTISEPMEQSATNYRLENDTVQAFFSMVLKVVGHTGKDTMVTVPSIYNVYRVWCEDYGLKPVSQHEFTRRAGGIGIQKAVRRVKGTTSNCFLGVQFTEYAEEAGYYEEYVFNESLRVSSTRRRGGGRSSQSQAAE